MSALHQDAPTIASPSAEMAAANSDAMNSKAAVAELLESLRGALGSAWWIVDTADRSMASAPTSAGDAGASPAGQVPTSWVAICGEVARRGQVELIADEDSLLGLAIPVHGCADPSLDNTCSRDSRYVLVGLFVSHDGALDRAMADRRSLVALERSFGWRPAEAARWLAEQAPWPPERLLSVAEMVLSRFAGARRLEALTSEATRMAGHLTDLYEEISLWHRLTRHLRISENEEELGRMALEWVSAAVPAESLVLQFLYEPDSNGRKICSADVFLTQGKQALSEDEFNCLIESLGLNDEVQTIIVNPPELASQLRDFPEIRQLIVVPLAVGENLIGWLAAVNHSSGEEFGSPEASLLASVASLLGIHAGNLALYRQQAEMLQGVVRALTSAIDAKDPYTCGHSDRVARIAVALAGELGCNRKQLQTLYLSGLLHDIGKIGIDDSVLRKPGKLSDAEYEHIKMHPEIGYRILHDLKELGEVLPVVRHHHEAWDGGGYPAGLTGNAIPQMARIVAVADAFDAMSSDRPYRKGMDDDRLDEILLAGSGKQWDSTVVEAFFRIRDKIREISVRKEKSDRVPEEVCRLT